MEPRIRFELLFRRYEPAVRAYALRRVSHSLADDVVAEVFLVCWRRFEEIPADALPWILGVARNVLGTLGRGEQRRTALRGRLAEVEASGQDEMVGVGDGVLAAAMARLSGSDRELLLLIAWEGLSTRQLAVSLGLRPSTARVRITRARRRLRMALVVVEASSKACVPTTMEVS
jgi:RNA polymerase sigma-70 factor (ECF subfamily)